MECEPFPCSQLTAAADRQVSGTHSRWLRVLFTREFSMQDAMVLWDGIFAVDPSLEIALWICVAMLIRIRNQCATFI
jgi:TBC1 domain family protein 5